MAGAKGQSYCVRWKVEAIEAAEVWPGMRLGSAPGAAPGLLSSDTVSDHRTLCFTIYKVICTEERLTIQIHKQEGTRTIAAGKIIKGHIKWVLYWLQRQCRVSESGTDRVLWDCYNVCNANMRQLELMPVINICCHTTRSLHNTATTAHMRAADRHRRDEALIDIEWIFNVIRLNLSAWKWLKACVFESTYYEYIMSTSKKNLM